MSAIQCIDSRSRTKATKRRTDVVFIRKSSPGQDEAGQKANVENMLRELGVYVPAANWFSGTVSRRNVKVNAEFNRLMDLVEADLVGTVYIESQDRWGTKDRPELFSLLGILREHSTRLYDLRAEKDLTEKDLATELLAFVGSIKSEKELQDISYRSLRTRVNNFKDTGSWPTGSHPYGYGKACYTPDGKLLWVFQPVDRLKGQVFFPGPDGELTPGPANIQIPRKARRDIIKLVPSNDPDRVRAVKLAFDLFVRVGLSRRQIAGRLNAEGLLINGSPFDHSDVTMLLRNSAYTGDTHFGKVQSGDLNTFDAKGLIQEVKRKEQGRKQRDVADRLIRTDTHEPLVDRTTWELAQKKLEAEQERTSFSPRNPAYYLKQLFVCGHCGKNLTGRTETDPKTKKKTVLYVCSTYSNGLCGKYQVSCGYQRITHEEAERLLLDKIKELNLPFDETGSEEARDNLKGRLAHLGHEDEKYTEQWQQWTGEGIDALAAYLQDAYPDYAEYPEIKKLRMLAWEWYWKEADDNKEWWANKPDDYKPLGLPLTLADLHRAVSEAEAAVVEEANKEIAELRQEHAALTRAWARATDLQQAVLKEDIEKLEAAIREWEPRTVPLSQRFEALYAAEAELEAERQKLLAEWPTLESREKGEALRRLFKMVTLFWERTFHPAAEKPTRPRKTNRPGRYGYTLQKDQIRWSFAATDLGGSW
jgi:hypothetical protein